MSLTTVLAGLNALSTKPYSKLSELLGALIDSTDLTRAQVAKVAIDNDLEWLRTTGYSAVGDGGGGLYDRVAAEPAHAGKVQSADGAWWELVPEGGAFHAKQFGVVADGSTDDTTALQNAVTATPAHHTLVIPANAYINGAIVLTADDVHLHFEGAVLATDTGTAATLVSGASGKVGFHYKKANRLKLTGTPRFVGQTTDGTTSLAHEVYDNCDAVQDQRVTFYCYCAAGRFIIQCDRSHFGDAIGRNIDGLQTFEATPTTSAGSVEIIIGCQHGTSGTIVAYDGDKPARYFSIDSNMRQTKSFHVGATIFDGLSGSTEAHAVAVRNALDCNIGPIIVGGTNISGAFINSYSTDSVLIDRVHVESILGKGAATGMSADTLLKVGGSGSPIGKVTVGSINGAADGEFGILVTHGSVHIGTAVLTGAATRLVAAYGGTAGVEASIFIGSLEIYDNSGSTPIIYGKSGHLAIGTLIASTGPSVNRTSMVNYLDSVGTGSAGTYDIGTIRYTQNGSAGDYTFLFLDAENGFEQGSIRHIDGTGSSAQANFAGDQVSVERGRYLDTQAPTAGTYSAGARVWNSAPSVDANSMILLGWSCVTAGTPGTWQPCFVSTVSPAT